MESTKTVCGGLAQWRRFKCTCGHCEDRKEDMSPFSARHSLLAVDRFQAFALDGKEGTAHPVK
jgi:hypothetical protein